LLNEGEPSDIGAVSCVVVVEDGAESGRKVPLKTNFSFILKMVAPTLDPPEEDSDEVVNSRSAPPLLSNCASISGAFS
jgi:hypothetical protein